MMHISTRFSSLLACVVLSVMSGTASFGQAYSGVSGSTVTGAVWFGTPQEYSDLCVNNGLCKDGYDNGGINVNFETVGAYPNCIKITFSLSELQQKQPEQVQSFQSGSYMFSADYCLSTDPALAFLNLPANAWILTTSNSYVVINGDVVTDYIQYTVVNN